MATNALPPAESNALTDERLLNFPDNRLLIDLCGEFDRNLAEIETALDVRIHRRGNELAVVGETCERAAKTLNSLYARLETGRAVEHGDILAAIRFEDDTPKGTIEIKTRKKLVEPRTRTQADYLRTLISHDLTFGLGPAGTGKTYLAVAVGVSMFIEGQVDRIILSRPAVEAGERLGFLPGDMKEKIDPYMQPLYDALNDFLPARKLGKLLEEKQIEIAPLAFMRGRTLSNAYVVLDEAQNATSMQMKMFLTRLGDGSRMAITGDMSQIDLPRGQVSGLIEAERFLRDVRGIGFTRFTSNDVVRHPMVAKIIDAYEQAGNGDV